MLKNLIRLSILLVPAFHAGCRATGAGSTTKDSVVVEEELTHVTSGRYAGTLKPDGQNQKIAAVLDLVETHREGATVSFRGVVRLMPGGFGSHEYSGLHFRDVTFDRKKKQLSFEGGPDGVTMANAKIKGGKLVGRFQSTKDALGGVLEVAPDDGSLRAGDAWARHLTGNYVGSCPGQVVSLQVEASKWRGMKATDDGVFGGYRIAGRVGQADDVACGAKQTCIKESYPTGTYNLLSGALELKTQSGTKTCRLQGDVVTCDGCSMTKDPISPHAVLDVQREFKLSERKERLKEPKNAEDDDGMLREPANLAGQYYGYLHHKRSDVYQLVALNVKSAPQSDAQDNPTGKQHVGGVATLYFGEGDSAEFVAYRFKEEMWPGPGGRFVFDGDGEATFVVERWTDKTIFGTWLSKTYGEIGTAELQRDLVPGLSSSAVTMERISGVYKGDDWDFELGVAANISEDPADYFPLKVFGWAREKIDHSRRRTIEEGSYDFHTGAFAFRLDDGRVIAGRVMPQGMQLFWPPKPRLGTPLVSGTTQLFRKVGENQTVQQAKMFKP